MIFLWGGFFLLFVAIGCSSPQKGPESEEIRENADKGMQDLRMEEERHKH